MEKDYFEESLHEIPEKKSKPDFSINQEINVKLPSDAKTKKEYKVIGIRNDTIIVSDEKGNGYSFPVTSELKKVKIGDTVHI